MPLEMGVWRIDQGLQRVARSTLEQEQRLEERPVVVLAEALPQAIQELVDEALFLFLRLRVRNPDRDGVFVRFSNGSGWEQEYDAYVHPGDRVEFDIYVCEDSEIVKGCHYNPGNGWNPFYTAGNGLNQDGLMLVIL